MQAMIQWDDLRMLLAAHRSGSLARAGRALGVDATTVGRRIAALERQLETALVVRTRDGLRTTPAGARAARAAASLEEAVAAMERELAGLDARVEGVVRVTSGEAVIVHALSPALPLLRAAHPLLRVELVGTSRSLDLARGEADLAVRLFRPREPGLVTRRVAVLRYGLYAAPSYLARAGTPRGAAELRQHDVIGLDVDLESTPEMRWLSRHVPEESFRIRASTVTAVVAACRAGMGIAAVAERFVERDPNLVRILPGLAPPTREAWLVLHPDLRRTARVVAVSKWIGEALAAPPSTHLELV